MTLIECGPAVSESLKTAAAAWQHVQFSSRLTSFLFHVWRPVSWSSGFEPENGEWKGGRWWEEREEGRKEQRPAMVLKPPCIFSIWRTLLVTESMVHWAMKAPICSPSRDSLWIQLATTLQENKKIISTSRLIWNIYIVQEETESLLLCKILIKAGSKGSAVNDPLTCFAVWRTATCGYVGNRGESGGGAESSINHWTHHRSQKKKQQGFFFFLQKLIIRLGKYLRHQIQTSAFCTS